MALINCMNNSHNLQNCMKDIPKAAHHLGLFTLLLICGVSLPTLSGLLVFPFSLIPTEMALTYGVGLCIIFLFSTAASCRNKSLKKYWTVWSAFFIASFVILVDISVNIPATSMDVMANGLREELLYRGLFLKRYETLLGSSISNLLQAIIFSLSHTVAGTGATVYTPFSAVFVLITFLLSLTWGYVMQRTDGLLGSVLFHAGSD